MDIRFWRRHKRGISSTSADIARLPIREMREMVAERRSRLAAEYEELRWYLIRVPACKRQFEKVRGIVASILSEEDELITDLAAARLVVATNNMATEALAVNDGYRWITRRDLRPETVLALLIGARKWPLMEWFLLFLADRVAKNISVPENTP